MDMRNNEGSPQGNRIPPEKELAPPPIPTPTS